MLDHTQVKLGKRAPRIDHRTLRLGSYLDMATLPPIPQEADWGVKVSKWGLMLNDHLGDCTCAAAGHLIMAWTADNGNEMTPADDAILKAYEDVGGYKPGDDSTDQGCVEIDVLNYWRKTGIANHLIGGYTSIEPKNHDHIKAAIAFMGGCYIGVALPLAAQGQTVWDVTDPALAGNAAPDSWGGHAVPLVAYNDVGPVCITWGMRQQMTWAWFDAYCDEAYAIFAVDWANEGKAAPSGFNADQLKADLLALQN